MQSSHAGGVLGKSPLQVKMDCDGGADGRSRETYEGVARLQTRGRRALEGERGRAAGSRREREKAVTRIRACTTATVVAE